MTKQEKLEGKCEFREQAEMKSKKGVPLSEKDKECLYSCNGYDFRCYDYGGLTSRERIVSFSMR